MANYSQDFQSQAQGLLGLVKGKLSETIGWKPLPGQLNKIVASSSGFVWGFNVNGDYYTCHEPCDGNNWKWTAKPPGMVGMPMDIAVDSQNVYTLFAGSTNSTSTTNQLRFAIQPVDGSGSWTVQSIPGDAPVNTQINVTDQFIFVGSKGCSKPCTTGNWVSISSPPGSGQSMGVVAASSGTTYVPVNAGGQIKVYSGAGNGQGGWTPQPGLAGKIPVAVEADNQFLYAQDSGSGGLYRCSTPYSDPASCQLEDTNGLAVNSGSHAVSVNPRSYQTYLTASSGGQYGNIFQRLDEGGLNVAPVIEQTKKYTAQMDSDVNALGGAVSSQNAQLSAVQTRQEAVGIINQMTNISDDIYNKKVKSGTVRQKVLTDGPDGPSIYHQRMLPLQILLATLLVVIVLYFVTVMFVSPTISMGLSIGVLAVGTGAAIYYGI